MMVTKLGRCYHQFYQRREEEIGREDIERCCECDCLPVGRDEETNEPYCDCCVGE